MIKPQRENTILQHILNQNTKHNINTTYKKKHNAKAQYKTQSIITQY